MKVPHAVAHVLAEEGVDNIFGLMGDGNMQLISYTQASLDIRWHGSRHESTAVAMADGYARATGRVGVCTVTQGPGLTNTLTALVTAAKAHSPLLIIIGDTARSQAGWPQDVDQRPFLNAANVQMLDIDDPATAHIVATQALRFAQEELRPVALNMPLDVQEKDWTPWTAESSSAPAEVPRSHVDANEIDAAVDALMASRRPVIVAGRGALRAGCEQEIIELAEMVGALLGTTLPAKGMFAGEDTEIGIVGSLGTNLAAKLVGEADCVLAVGASLNDFTTLKRSMFDESATVIRADVVTEPMVNRYRAHLSLTGDAARVVSQLMSALRTARPDNSEGYRSPAVLDELRSYDLASEFADASGDTGLDPRTLALIADEILPPTRTIVTDVGHFFGFPATYMSVDRGGKFIPAVDFGAVGVGLGTAIGVAAGRPDELTVLFIGDGGLMMSLGDLETVARDGAKLLIIVMNDQAYGSELHMLRQWKLVEDAAVFSNPSFERVAESLGVPATTVSTVEQLQKTLRQFHPTQGPLLVDCAVTAQVMAAWLEGAFKR